MRGSLQEPECLQCSNITENVHPSMGGNSGKLCPWASLHDLQVVQQVQEFSLPKVLPAYMTLGREGPCESDKFQVLSKICELFPS